MIQAVSVAFCAVCGSSEFDDYRQRSDGILVIRCRQCGMGVAAKHRADLDAIYDDTYFRSDTVTGWGYEDYSASAEAGVAWAAKLIRLLKPEGRVLDIGCADGSLLSMLKGSHELFGVEVNPTMAARARESGAKVIAASIFNPTLVSNFQQSMDVVSAIAVFEHLLDFRAAFEIALKLLKPDGVLIFEVPLISPANPSDVWFRSSLEHVYYPFKESLEYLFQALGCHSAGFELVSSDYGSTYIGIASHALPAGLMEKFQRLSAGKIEELAPDEKEFRISLDLIHGGNVTPELLRACADLGPRAWTDRSFKRFLELCARDATKLAEATAYLEDVKMARDWHRDQAEKWASAAKECSHAFESQAAELLKKDEEILALKKYLGEVESARDWHRNEAEKWAAAAQKKGN